MNIVNELLNALFVIFLVFILFMIFRHLVCWYWKINDGIKLITEIRDDLRAIRGMSDDPDQPHFSWLADKDQPKTPEPLSKDGYPTQATD